MIFCIAVSWGTRVGCITMRCCEKIVSFNDTAIDQDSLQNFHLPDHISTDLSTESKSKIVWLKTTHSTYHLTINTMFNLHVWQLPKTTHSTYHLTINTMFNLHVWQLPHFISSIWTKTLKQNMFHIVYNYKANLHFADNELGQITALHSHNIVTLLEKRLNAGHQSTLNCHYQTCQIPTVPCNCNIKYALHLFHTNTCIYSQRQT